MDPNQQPSNPNQNPGQSPIPEPTPAPEAPLAPEFAPVPEQPSVAPSNEAPVVEGQPVQPMGPSTPPAHDPGKGLAIAGIVLAFFGTQLIGLVLSIVAHSKSKRVGIKNTLATVGIILNSVMIVLALILVPLFFFTTLASYNAVQDRARQAVDEARLDAENLSDTGAYTTADSKANAMKVVKAAEVFRVNNPEYPLYFSDLELTGTRPPEQSIFEITSKPSTPQLVEFYSCDGQGNKVGYWDYDTNSVAYVYSGAATGMECTFVRT